MEETKKAKKVEVSESIFTNEQKLQMENEHLKKLLNDASKQLEQMNLVNVFKRLEFLFKVIEHSNAFSSDFVVSCVDEIEDRMALSEPEEEK